MSSSTDAFEIRSTESYELSEESNDDSRGSHSL